MNLSNDDRCAVDLLLEHAPPGSSTSCLANAPTADIGARLTAVEQVLKSLDYYKVPEPSLELVGRTLAACDALPTRHLPREAVTPSTVMNAR
jgi:hypothetical protein